MRVLQISPIRSRHSKGCCRLHNPFCVPCSLTVSLKERILVGYFHLWMSLFVEYKTIDCLMTLCRIYSAVLLLCPIDNSPGWKKNASAFRIFRKIFNDLFLFIFTVVKKIHTMKFGIYIFFLFLVFTVLFCWIVSTFTTILYFCYSSLIIHSVILSEKREYIVFVHIFFFVFSLRKNMVVLYQLVEILIVYPKVRKLFDLIDET